MAASEVGDEADVADAASVGGRIARAQAGDRMAFGQLIEEHYELIFRIAYKWTGSRADAEDMTQEVCVKLATAIAGFDGRAAFATWLYRVTLNTVRDLQRQRQRRSRQAGALREVSPADQPPDQEEAATMGELWAAVRRLPDRQRDAVLLVYAEEMSHAEAALVMGARRPRCPGTSSRRGAP